MSYLGEPELGLEQKKAAGGEPRRRSGSSRRRGGGGAGQQPRAARRCCRSASSQSSCPVDELINATAAALAVEGREDGWRESEREGEAVYELDGASK